ncbi:MAG: hypothetical protein ACI97A_003725 [Planctomycetota bacterium]
MTSLRVKEKLNRDPWCHRILPIAIVFLALCQLVQAQRWIERDGGTLILNCDAAMSEAPKQVNIHHAIQILGSDLSFERSHGELIFVARGQSNPERSVFGRSGDSYQSTMIAEFDVPILDVGIYDLYFRMTGLRRKVGVVAIPAFRCYFNWQGDARQASSLADIVRPLGMGSTMALHVDRAQKTLDIAMSDFDHPDYITAIVRAHKRGVRVRFITDQRAKNEEPWARAEFTAAGVPWITNGRDLADSTYMHHKFMIVDEQIVLMGHAKAARSHDVVNQSFVSINGKPVAAIYRNEFNQMWGGVGVESPAKSRRFNVAKKPGNHHFCMIQGLHGKVRVDIGFGPSKKPSFSPLTRPLNFILAQLLLRATSDVGFLASGFGDIDIGKVIRDLIDKKGVKFYGVQGEPDWSIDANPLIKIFRGEGPDGWKEPADVVGSHDRDDDQGWINVHNRAMVIDVLGVGTKPVVCFSSGAWCMGVIKADDSMVCIHDRGIAEQFLQHVGGTRARAFRPLAHRNVLPTVKKQAGELFVSAEELIPLLGGQVTRSLHGEGVMLRLGERALIHGKVDVDSSTLAVAKIALPSNRRLFVSLHDLAYLGLRLEQTSEKSLVCVDANGLSVPLVHDGDLKQLILLLNQARPEENIGFGLTFQPPGTGAMPTSAIRAQEVASGLIKVENRLPCFGVEEASGKPIYADPCVLIALEQAIQNMRLRFPGLAPVIVVDGAGLRGRHARNKAGKAWKPRRGAGLVIRVPKIEDSTAALEMSRLFFQCLLEQKMTRFHFDTSLLGSSKPLEFLQDGDPDSYVAYRRPGTERPGFFTSPDGRTHIRFSTQNNRQIEFEQSLRDFRSSIRKDLVTVGAQTSEVGSTTVTTLETPTKKNEELTIRLFPVGGAVYLDRVFVRNLSTDEPCVLHLDPGGHELVVSRSGYHDHVSSIVAKLGAKRSVLISLAPLKKLLPHESHERILRPGMTARGQLTLKAPFASDLLTQLRSDQKITVTKSRAIRIELEELSLAPVALELISHGARIDILVVDDKGVVVAKDSKKAYRVRISFQPKEKRRYYVILSHSVMNKAAIYDLVRYAIAVVPSPRSN